MRPAEAFMLEFFRARIVEEQQHQANRASFRRKYFAEDCRHDSHADTLRRMESEKIVTTDGRDSETRVITEQTVQHKGQIRRMRFRYHLQPLNDDWLIHTVQTGCLVCEGRGDKNCPYCKGRLWLGADTIRD